MLQPKRTEKLLLRSDVPSFRCPPLLLQQNHLRSQYLFSTRETLFEYLLKQLAATSLSKASFFSATVLVYFLEHRAKRMSPYFKAAE